MIDADIGLRKVASCGAHAGQSVGKVMAVNFWGLLYLKYFLGTFCFFWTVFFGSFSTFKKLCTCLNIFGPLFDLLELLELFWAFFGLSTPF